jgi:hypothetical protein
VQSPDEKTEIWANDEGPGEQPPPGASRAVVEVRSRYGIEAFRCATKVSQRNDIVWTTTIFVSPVPMVRTVTARGEGASFVPAMPLLGVGAMRAEPLGDLEADFNGEMVKIWHCIDWWVVCWLIPSS